MSPGITKTIRSRWLAGVMHVGLWILLYLALTGLRGPSPGFRVADHSNAPLKSVVPMDKIDSVFAAPWPRLKPGTNELNPFVTTYFTPPVVLPTPAPTTRKIQLEYHGFYIADGS